MSQVRCNDVVARYDARAAWTASCRDMVGLYLATDAGVIFVKIPAKVLAHSIAVKVDGNQRPLPTAAKVLTVDELPDVVRASQVEAHPEEVVILRSKPTPGVVEAARRITSTMTSPTPSAAEHKQEAPTS